MDLLKRPIAARMYLERLLERLSGRGLGATLARGAVGAFVVNVLGVGVMFAAHVLLARILGVDSYGVFVYGVTWLNILVLPGKFGMDTAAVRFVAEYNATERWGMLRGFVRVSEWCVLGLSSLVSAALGGVVLLLLEQMSIELAGTLSVVCLVIPVYSLLLVRVFSLRALKHIVKAQSALKLLRPTALIVAVSVAYLLFDRPLGATFAMQLNLLAVSGALLLSGYFFWAALPAPARMARPEYAVKFWVTVALPMLAMTAILQTQNQVDVAVVGVFLESADVGKYAAVKNISMLVTFGLTSVFMIANPIVAELYHQDRHAELQRVLTLAVRGSMLFSIPATIAVLLFGKRLLALYGNDFATAYLPLVILTICELLVTCIGSIGSVLLMTGHQKPAAALVLVSLAANVVLSFLLVPSFGLMGAAFAQCGTLVVCTVSLFVYGLMRLRLDTSILGMRR